VAASVVTSRAGIRGGGNPRGGSDEWQPPAPSAVRVVRAATGNRAACGTRRLSRRSKQKRAADRWTWPSKIYFQIFKLHSNFKFKKEAFPYSKNIQAFHADRFGYFEQLSQLG
jgi:hypothetical protein